MKTKIKLLLALMPFCFLLQSQVSINAPKYNSEVIEKPADSFQLINENLYVIGSLCVGLDCVNNESFGFDTQRLKENNLRIKFEDTSTTASFPTNDWEISINDSSNGGDSYFAVNDITGGKTPFKIIASAPSNSIYVNSSGKVGFGTATPAIGLHRREGNTPALRLEQDGSSGFNAQTWDVAGNESNFFIRDVTNSSKLPFRIFPNSPSSSIEIKNSGVNIKNVGLIDPTSPSDERLKRNMIAISDATALLKQLIPKTFYFNEKSINKYGMPAGKHYGLIAQEVESVLPELIRNVTFGEDKTKFKSVRYESFISILIKGFKEQQEKLEGQQEKIDGQLVKLEKQSDEIKDLKTQLAKYSDLDMRLTAIENSQKRSSSIKTSK